MSVISEKTSHDQISGGVSGQSSVRSIERCFDILDLIAANPGGLSLTGISRELDIPKSTALVIVRTLVARRLLYLDGLSKLYKIGLGFSRFALHAPPAVLLSDLAQPVLQTLVAETGETSSIAATDGVSVFYVARLLSAQPIHYWAPVGQPSPMHCTASGKLFLSRMASEDAVQTLERNNTRFTARTIIDASQLIRELDQVRKDGYALSIGEFHDDVLGVAGPIYNSRGDTIASIGSSGPLQRMQAKLPDVITAVQDAASAISAEVARISDNVRVFQGNGHAGSSLG